MNNNLKDIAYIFRCYMKTHHTIENVNYSKNIYLNFKVKSQMQTFITDLEVQKLNSYVIFVNFYLIIISFNKQRKKNNKKNTELISLFQMPNRKLFSCLTISRYVILN